MEDAGSSPPEELLSSGSSLGNEYRCRKKELLKVAAIAVRDGLALDGWQVQFRTADGECELCWKSFYSEEKKKNERWLDYVGRSWEEARRKWQQLFDNEELIEEGRRIFRLIQATEEKGVLPRDTLWFILYFRSSTQKKSGKSHPSPSEISD
jgi:hypothetical protein